MELTRKKVDDVLGGEDAWKNVDSIEGKFKNEGDKEVIYIFVYAHCLLCNIV